MSATANSSPRLRVVIVGRPNVGKSTLFNRLLGRRRALVHDEPGVTRDRIEEKATWWVRAKRYGVTLVDTGGLGEGRFSQEIQKQVEIALSSADVVLMVFDSQAGLTPADRELAREFKRSGLDQRLPLFAIVNKVDDDSHESLVGEFYAAGIERVLTLSAEHGRGIDDLQEAIVEATEATADVIADDLEESISEESLDEEPTGDLEAKQATEIEDLLAQDEEAAENAPAPRPHSKRSKYIYLSARENVDTAALEKKAYAAEVRLAAEDAEEEREREGRGGLPRIAVVGRPNVGKSTLVNAFLGEERMIVSPIMGTTVDAIDSICQIDGKPFVIIDTAGIRRKSKTEQGIEVLSVVQTRKALERADIAILMLDGDGGITDQDEKIGGIIEEVGSSVILAMNKWDTQKKNHKFTKEMAAERIRAKMPFLKYAPIVFMSAKRGEGMEGLSELVEEILHQRRFRVPTHEFTEWLRKESLVHNPANVKFFLSHQAGRHPPTFVSHVNTPQNVHYSLKRHLINALRERWGYMGTPLRLHFVAAKRGKTGLAARSSTREAAARGAGGTAGAKRTVAKKATKAGQAGAKRGWAPAKPRAPRQRSTKARDLG